MSTEVTTVIPLPPPPSLPENPPPIITTTTTTPTTTANTNTNNTNNTNNNNNNNNNIIITNNIIKSVDLSNIKRRKRKAPKLLNNVYHQDIVVVTNNNNNTNGIIDDNNNNNNVIKQQEHLHQHQHLGNNFHPSKKRRLNDSSSASSSMVTFSSESYSNRDATIDSANFSIELQSHQSDKTILPEGKEGQGAAVLVNRDHQDNSDDVRVKAPQVNADGTEIYQGLKSYRDPTRDPTARKAPKFLGIGPQRAPDNVKITCRFDYQPDICKDWKETGYCGYGLSCKFVHDRSDYKAGWQIENDWNQYQKHQKLQLKVKGGGILTAEEQAEWDKFQLGKGQGANDNPYEIHDSDDDDEVEKDAADGLPFACYICRESFKDPVVTKCGHYFCEQCAFKQYRKTPACAICGEKTEGQFSTADKLVRKLKAKGKI